VIEERHPGVDGRLAGAVDSEVDGDLGLLRAAGNAGAALLALERRTALGGHDSGSSREPTVSSQIGEVKAGRADAVSPSVDGCPACECESPPRAPDSPPARRGSRPPAPAGAMPPGSRPPRWCA